MLPLLLAISQPADAGLGSLVRAAAKLGSSAGKAGGAATKAGGVAAKAGGVAGKGGVALKGASLMGAAVAAERVFVHMDDPARLGVYVASSGDDGLRVVMEGGDELRHTAGSFKGFAAELDEMAAVSPDAGVDLYVDAEALRHLGDLELGPNTRLFLANTEGASWPLRTAADGAAEVGVGRTWFRAEDVAIEALQLGIDLAQHAVDSDELRMLVTDPDCGPVPGSLASLAEARAGDRVVVLGAAPDAFEALAQLGRFDVVVPGIADPCPAGAGDAALAEVLGRVRAAETMGDLWTVAQADASVVIDELKHEGSILMVRGVGLLAVHVLAPVALQEWVDDDDDEPPAWFYALCGVGVVGFGAWKIRRWTST